MDEKPSFAIASSDARLAAWLTAKTAAHTLLQISTNELKEGRNVLFRRCLRQLTAYGAISRLIPAPLCRISPSEQKDRRKLCFARRFQGTRQRLAGRAPRPPGSPHPPPQTVAAFHRPAVAIRQSRECEERAQARHAQPSRSRRA